MALTTVNTGETVEATHVNQFKNAFEGAATNTYLLKAATGTDFQVKLFESAGATYFRILDGDGNSIFTVDSNGNVVAGGSVTGSGGFTFPTAASPSQTTDGQAVWDSDDDVLTVGTGAATKKVTPSVAAGFAPATKGEFGFDTTAKRITIHDGTSAFPVSPIYKYVAATQTLSASVTYVDVIAAGSPATMTFTMAANEVWHARYRLRLIYTGTGGASFKLQGPASPTALRITGADELDDVYGAGDALRGAFRSFAAITAYNTAFASGSAASPGFAQFDTTDTGAFIDIDVFIINGSTAGDVTLQFAQAGANGTTVMQIGSWMKAERVA